MFDSEKKKLKKQSSHVTLHIFFSNSSIYITVTSRFPLATLVFARRRAAAGLRASPFVMSKGQMLIRRFI
jgi:exopolysaccharide biosynthesis protein